MHAIRFLSAVCALALSALPTQAQAPWNPNVDDDDLAPLGARAAGGQQAWFHAPSGTYRFRFNGPDPREYRIDVGHPFVQRGLVHVYEVHSGTFPIYRGGAARRTLAGGILWAGSGAFIGPHYSVAMDPPAFDGQRLAIHYRETYEGVTIGKTVTYSLRGKTLLVELEGDGGGGPALGNWYALDLGSATLAGARSLYLPYMSEPLLVGDGVFASIYADVTLSNGNHTQIRGPLVGATSIAHHRYTSYQPDSAGRVQRLRERVYATVSAAVEDTFPASNAGPSPYRGDAVDDVVYDTWGVDRQPTGIAPFANPFALQLEHFAELRNVYGLKNVTVLRHNWGSAYDHAYPKIYPASWEAGGDTAFRALVQGAAQWGWRFAAHENLSTMFAPNAFAPAPAWYDPAKISKHADLSFRKLGELPPTPSWAIVPADQLDFVYQHTTYLRQQYGINAGFWDVGSYRPPYVNLDAQDPRSKTYFDSVREIKRAFAEWHNVGRGPLLGEAVASHDSWDLVWAGYIDGLERELPGGEHGLVIPDVELRVFQPLQANQGMGYPARFFDQETRDQAGYPTEANYDFLRARTVAFGHTGFITDALTMTPASLLGVKKYLRTMTIDQILKEHYLLLAYQRRALSSPVVSIAYDDGGVQKTLGEKLQELRAGTSSAAAFAAELASFFREPRVAVRFANGLEVRVNASRTQDWAATAYGHTYLLPPSGFVAEGPGFVARTSYRNNLASEPVESQVSAPEYLFYDSRAWNLLTITLPGKPPIYVPY